MTIILWLYIDIRKLSGKLKASLQQTDRLGSTRMSICFISDGIEYSSNGIFSTYMIQLVI